MKYYLGIDVGGSGIKGALVNCKKGLLKNERIRIPTPQPASPEFIADTIKNIVMQHKYEGPVGVGFPAVIKNGVVCTAANIEKNFIGLHYENYLCNLLKMPVVLLNDADAAAIAELKYGIGIKEKGLIILITIGTGIGTVISYEGKIIPNTELGHIYMSENREAEQYASDATRHELNLSWEQWTSRINEYLIYLENLFWPDLFIIGGGISKHESKFLNFLKTRTKVVTAKLLNNAGIIGAAIAAKKKYE